MRKRRVTENTGTVQQISHNIEEFNPNTVITTSSSTGSYSTWSFPILLETIITEEGVEQIFRQDSNVTYTVFYQAVPCPRIYKNVYRIVDGKLKLTETIEGKYVPQQEESYEF